MNKIIRISTVSISLDKLLEGQLAFLSNNYEVVGVSSDNDHNLKFIGERENVRVQEIEIERKIKIIKDVKSLFLLIILFSKEKPLIVHSITPKAGLLSMIAAYFTRVPIRIHTFTGLIFPTQSGFKKHLLKFMDRILCKCATQIYPEGEGVRNDLIAHRITSKPLKIIANGNVNGINTVYFNPNLFSEADYKNLRKQLSIQPEDHVFVFVGRLVSDKGINELIHAFKKISTKKNNVKLLLVGPLETQLDPLLPDTLKEISENQYIISVGYQQDVRPYFAISDTLVFPSYREGFPNVVMQAGAMGLPSIVTNINGCNEIITHDDNGLIIPVKDAQAIFTAMIKLLVNQILYKKLQQNARQIIVENYEQKVVWQELLKEYRRLESAVS